MGTLAPEVGRIGEIIDLTIAFDPSDRTISPHPSMLKALQANNEAKKVFDSMRPSARHEIIRYIANLKNSESIERNIQRVIGFLLGKESFAGRDKPYST